MLISYTIRIKTKFLIVINFDKGGKTLRRGTGDVRGEKLMGLRTL